MLAQNVILSGLNHTYENIHVPIKDQMVTTNQIMVEDGAWIGANSVVTAGVVIGKNSVVAGGSTVTKNVAPYTVAAGNPARAVKRYCMELEKWIVL